LTLLSPCIGICQIDERFGFCRGCARSRSEVATWAYAPRETIDRVWSELPARRAQMGLGMHRLRWSLDDLRAFIVNSLRFGGGTWVAGVYGAVAEFCVGDGEIIALNIRQHSIGASSSRGAISLRLSDHVRALAFGASQNLAESEIIVLAVLRKHATFVPHFGLTNLGPDVGSIRTSDRDEHLYDLGLGRIAAGFGIRTADPVLTACLERCSGLDWPDVLSRIGAEIVQSSPTRVVRHSLGRNEVFTAIPPPGGQSPPGPHTHLLPRQLSSRVDLPPNLTVPDVYVPCAVHYPQSAAMETASG
jgi:predicted Fe-S protein YdhL (DUF1289 family)